MAGGYAHTLGAWRITPALSRISRDGESKQLEPTAMAVLVYLLDHANESIGSRALFDAVWPDRTFSEATVADRIDRLRRALGDGHIEVDGDGYRLRGAIGRVTDDARTDDATLPALAAETPPFPAYVGDEPYAFVCYAHANRAQIYPELVTLRAAGINVWYDEGITPGSEWTEEIATAIRGCSAFLYYVSSDSVASRNCRDEVQFALKESKRLVIVHLEPTALPGGLELAIGSTAAIRKHELRPGAYQRQLLRSLRNDTQHRIHGIARPRLLVAFASVAIVLAAFAAYRLTTPATPKITGYKQLTQVPWRFSPAESPYPVITDGARIYFTEWAGGDLAMRQISIRGGESVVLPSPFTTDQYPMVAGITPDRTELIVGALDPATNEPARWLWSPSGASSKRLAAPFTHDLIWSNDGTIRVSATRDIIVARGDGSEPLKIGTAPGVVGWSRVSPDNSRIRFTAKDPRIGTFTTLWEVSIDGKNMRQLLAGWNDPPNECCGSWTPDGKFYVFQANREGRMQLWALPEDGDRDPIALTPASMDFAYPNPTDEGRIIALGWQLGGEVMRYDRFSKRWGKYLDGRSAEWLSFSDDEAWVTYVSYPQGQLWRSRIDGREPLRLTSRPWRPTHSAWSPDGKSIAFFDSLTRRLFLVPADGSSAPRRLNESEHVQCCHSWSPDGRTIAMSTEPDTLLISAEAGVQEILQGAEALRQQQAGSDQHHAQVDVQALSITTSIVSVRSTQPGIALVEVETGKEQRLEGSEGFRQPQWSADGRSITAISPDERIVRFDVEQRTWTDVVSVPGVWYHLALDGQSLYVVFGGGDVASVDLADGSIETIAALADLPRAWGSAGAWIGVTPDGSPLYLRDTGIYHVYALDWDA